MAPTVVMLLKTTGLEYDDRVRKECASLHACGEEPFVLVLDRRNRAETGRTEQGVSYRAIRLLSRHVFPRRRGLILKLAETYLRFTTRVILVRPRVVWLHNVELAGLLPVLSLLRRVAGIERIIWDQHELPPNWMIQTRLGRAVLGWLCGLADAVVVASGERRKMLLQLVGGRAGKEVHVLENYPDDHFAQLPVGPIPADLKDWLNGRRYFVAQGGAAPGRRFEELAEAILKTTEFCLVVVGFHDQRTLQFLDQKYGERWRRQVFFTGFIPQLQLHRYLDGAIGSVVFYANVSSNNWLCAPNRLYQAISRGLPVLVGANPPMASVVRKFGCGIVLSSDGSDPEEIAEALCELARNEAVYRAAAQKASRRLLWNMQDGTIARIVRPPEVSSLPA